MTRTPSNTEPRITNVFYWLVSYSHELNHEICDHFAWQLQDEAKDCDKALQDVIDWVHERTGFDKLDLLEIAHGLEEGRPLAPIPNIVDCRDFRPMLAKLEELDRKGATAELLRQKPEIAKFAGIELKPLSTEVKGAGSHDGTEIKMPASWFKMKFGIPPSRLRSAHKRGKIRAEKPGRFWQYIVVDAQSEWPEDEIYIPTECASDRR
jgi:hypothetical protein